MSISFFPSGPPRKRGNASLAFRQYSRRVNSKKLAKDNASDLDELNYKRRKIFQSSLDLPIEAPNTALYEQLRELEEKLDTELDTERKRVQELMTSPPNTLKGILRVHVFNTHFNQSNPDAQPAWSLRIQGRLIHPVMKELYGRERGEVGYVKKFSSFFKRIQVVFPEGEKIEWQKPQVQRETDGMEVKRQGNTEVELKVLMYLDYNPPKLKLKPTLAKFVGATEETRENVLAVLWSYIKTHRLIDPEERRYINNDAILQGLFNETRTELATVIEKFKHLTSEPDPIVIHHRLRLSGDWTETEHLHDIAVDVEDPFQFELASFLGESQSVIFSHNSFTNIIPALRANATMEIPQNPINSAVVELDRTIADEIKEVQKHLKRKQLIAEFLDSPTEAVMTLVEEQETHIQTLHAISKYERINQDYRQDEQTSVFFKQPFVKDVVDRYLETHKRPKD
jgi:SWI/SNF-related matrix-associated actin-dependent regulator of chromatin subfamily D